MDYHLDKIVKSFNEYFVGDARLVVSGQNLEVTIRGQTMAIRLPGVIGFQSSSQRSLETSDTHTQTR